MRRHFAKEVSLEVRIKTISKLGFIVVLIGLVLFTLGGAASASTNQNGPTPPKLGDPVGANVAPHGGFSATTNFCLQCHSVHPTSSPLDPNEGAYALLWKDSVTATCNTCHGIDGGFGVGGATGTRDTNTLLSPASPPSLTIGTTSSRTAYDLAGGVRKAAHTLGAGDTADTNDNVQMLDNGWGYGGFNATNWTANQSSGALECTSCHTPHGEQGRLINSTSGVIRTTADGDGLSDPDTWVNDAPIYFGTDPATRQPLKQYLHLNGTVWQACTQTGGAGTCTDLTTRDSEGQTVYLFGYKMLTAYPNHDYTGSALGGGGGESWGVDARSHDQARWCGTCHPNKVAAEYGGTYHNHPTGCTACHGNPTDQGTVSADFPHTSTFAMFLKSYPDGLCVSCHTAGSLP
jgi:hypothetical protein